MGSLQNGGYGSDQVADQFEILISRSVVEISARTRGWFMTGCHPHFCYAGFKINRILFSVLLEVRSSSTFRQLSYKV